MTIQNLREIADSTVVFHATSIVYVDVDETLVLWDAKNVDPEDTIITVKDPYIGTQVSLVPHIRNINLLKRNHAQGQKIVVWSYGGTEWAELIVKTLGLEPWVHLILLKPTKIIDDHDLVIQKTYLSKHFDKHSRS